ncbi:hypothetical protein V2A60_002155 [Cordyceps javanica]
MDDDSFGPRLSGHFDFTLRFEHAFFQIIPCSSMILVLPYYIRIIVNSPALVRSGLLLWAKLALAAAVAVVQLTSIVLWHNSSLNTSIAQAGSVLAFLASLGTVVVTYASHKHCLQPAVFLCLFLSGTFLLDLVSIYSYYHRESLGALTWLTCALPVLKLALIILEELSKRSLLISEEAKREFSSEVFAGFWSRCTFAWINPLLFFGFRNRIKNDQLPEIRHQFNSEKKFLAFKRLWDKRDENDKYALLKCCFLADPWPFVYIIIPRLLQIGIIFSQPFLLQAVVNFVSGDTPIDGMPRDQRGTSLIFATALVFFSKTLTANVFSHLRNQIMVSTRGILSTAIYKKTLALSASEAEELASVTLITTDMAGIERLVSVCYESWALIVETIGGITILSFFVGASSIFSLISATLVTIIARQVASKMNNARKRWNEHISVRVASTSTILAQIRDIKMLGLAPSAAVHLQKMYDEEIDIAVSERKMMSLTFGVTSLTETSAPMLVIAGALFWTRADHTISTARFFSILTATSMVANQWSWFLRSLSSWAAGFACVSRVQEYLNKPEVKDPRGRLDGLQESPSGSSEKPLSINGKDIPAAVQIQNVVVCMDEKAGPILKDTTVHINAGETTMLYGAVGCGKSTFLRALLGEVVLQSGSISLASLSTAYAGQQPWLLNATIRANIIGHKAYDAVLYRKVVYICALDVDFHQLPDGDETMAGNAGANLSGGQKQRVSMARAFYLEADITVLDDPFSALDKETSAVVRGRLLVEGHATAKGRTLIMSTSMREHLVDADTILHVTDQGDVLKVSLEEAVAHPEEFTRELPLRQKAKAEAIDGDLEELPTVKEVEEAEEPEEARTDRGDFSLYAYYLRPAGALRVITFFILNTLGALSEVMPIIYARIWHERDPSNNLYYIGFAVLCMNYPVAIAAGAIFYYFIIHVKTTRGLHDTLVKSTFGATYEFLMNEDAGSILNRFSQDMSTGAQQVALYLLPAAFRAVTVLIDIGTISAGATYAAAIIPFFVVLTAAVQQYYLRTSRQLRVLELETARDMVRHLTETAHGVEHIRAFGSQADAAGRFAAAFGVTQRPLYFLACVQQWLEGVLDLSTGVAAVVVVALAVKFPDTATASSMGLSMMSLISFSSDINEFISASVIMETALGAVARIRTYAATTPAEAFQGGGPPVPAEWPSSGKIELSSVSAVYKPRNSAPFSPTGNITVVVNPGETLGVVGRTGSGKSTVLLSILNLLEYTGTIAIDGREIRTLPPDELRARITTVTQSGVQLRGSVRYNLSPFEPARHHHQQDAATSRDAADNDGHNDDDDDDDDGARADALRRVGLWEAVPGGGDLGADMKDMKLSHGQRQLFQLARAILHRRATGSRVLLMDEGTASLDEDTEARVGRVLADEFAGCTKIVISHRAATLRAADAIMTLKDGRATVVRGRVSDERAVEAVEE